MQVRVIPGKYIVAVSGGVDSMVLLDLLAKASKAELIVAHFDHGIRADSARDAEFVAAKAEEYRLTAETGRARLRRLASEATARNARYEFLRAVQSKHSASAIITAHHQDDLIETAMLNILRGSGPRGLVSMLPKEGLLRPLLVYRKSEIIKYANLNNLAWREDATNLDEKYLRNYLRRRVMPKMTPRQRRQILKNIEKVAKSLTEQDKIIATLSHSVAGGKIKRTEFSQLPGDVGSELLAHFLRSESFRDFDSALINRANMLIRTGSAGSSYKLRENVGLILSKNEAKLTVGI